MRLRALPLVAVLLFVAAPATLRGQEAVLVEAIAPLLMAEDRRTFDPALFAQALAHPDPLVRRTATVGIGRIGDRRATPLLLPMLADRDAHVVADAFFALGQLGDTTAVPAILQRLRAADSLSAAASDEAATALTRLGSADAVAALTEILAGGGSFASARRAQLLPNALLDGWRLAAKAPTSAMLAFASDTSVDRRWRAIYTLARLRVPAAGRQLLAAVRDREPLIRETAVKALTRAYADSAGLPEAAVRGELLRAIDDEAAPVRVNALIATASWRDSSFATRIAAHLADPDLNVRVQAATALGEVRGAVAARELDAALGRVDGNWALTRAAFTALARVDTAVAARRVATWAASREPQERIAALEAMAAVGLPRERYRDALADPELRVQVAALGAWRAAVPRGTADSALLAAARERLTRTEPTMRTAAAQALAPHAVLADLDPLLAAWRAGANDGEADARLAVLAALAGMARRNPDVMAQLGDASRRTFLEPPADLQLRREAARSWPALAEVWGPAGPQDTGRSLEDYRTITRTIYLARVNPKVVIELEGKGRLELELLGRDAPLTVANFLRLVDRRWYDGNKWHRVVPNFVVQTGDRTGTGSGGPGWSIRAEVNRQRYGTVMAGMADSGLDTAGAQWFLNLSPQPHLDGRYTIFGRLSGAGGPVRRIVQGDQIRSIRR